MTNREKLIKLLTEENDGRVNAEEISCLLEKSPLRYPCPHNFKCEDSDNSCEVCVAKWLNKEVKE